MLMAREKNFFVFPNGIFTNFVVKNSFDIIIENHVWAEFHDSKCAEN